MASEKEKTPTNADQEGEVINSLASARSSDGLEGISQQVDEQPVSATSVSQFCCNAESVEEVTGSKKTLDGMYFDLEHYKT